MEHKKLDKTERLYSREALLQSAALRGYQPDFAGALLTKDQYTLAEAKSILAKFAEGAV